jgi:hypothetical protein
MVLGRMWLWVACVGWGMVVGGLGSCGVRVGEFGCVASMRHCACLSVASCPGGFQMVRGVICTWWRWRCDPLYCFAQATVVSGFSVALSHKLDARIVTWGAANGQLGFDSMPICPIWLQLWWLWKPLLGIISYALIPSTSCW